MRFNPADLTTWEWWAIGLASLADLHVERGEIAEAIATLHTLTGLDQTHKTLAVIGNKISFSILVSSLILGAAWALQVPTPYKLFGYPLISFLVFAIAATMGLWLIIAIMRSGTLRQ